MPRYILHHDGFFFEWSTIVDAPVSPAMTKSEFNAYWLHRHGSQGMSELEDRLARAEATGSSSFRAMSVRDCVRGNRAGDRGEAEISFDEVIDIVKRERPDFGLPALEAPTLHSATTTAGPHPFGEQRR